MTRRIIILGHSGFIGSWLYKEFSAQKRNKVIGLSSKECDMLSQKSLGGVLEDLRKTDVVIMCAAISRLTENTFESMVKNIQMAQNLSAVLSQKRVRQLIFLSSIDVYGSKQKSPGHRPQKMNEQTLLSPDDYYGISKVISEFLLMNQCNQNKIPLAVLRIPGVYGPGDKNKSLVSLFIKQGKDLGEICVYGKGKELRDYIFVRDLCGLVEKVVMTRFSGVLNVVSSRSYSIFEIAQIVRNTLAPKAKIIFKTSKRKLKRDLDILFNNALLKKVFPEVKINNLRRGIPLYRRYLNSPVPGLKH